MGHEGQVVVHAARRGDVRCSPLLPVAPRYSPLLPVTPRCSPLLPLHPAPTLHPAHVPPARDDLTHPPPPAAPPRYDVYPLLFSTMFLAVPAVSSLAFRAFDCECFHDAINTTTHGRPASNGISYLRADPKVRHIPVRFVTSQCLAFAPHLHHCPASTRHRGRSTQPKRSPARTSPQNGGRIESA